MSWGRVGSVGRFDRLWHTDGRPFVRGAHQRHGAAWQVASRRCGGRFEYAAAGHLLVVLAPVRPRKHHPHAQHALPPDGSVGGNLRLIPDGPSGEDVGAGCLHNLPHFTDGYFTGARLLDGG